MTSWLVTFQCMAFMLEKLIVYQRSVDFADRIDTLTESFPYAKQYLSNQLNRSALSIANNIAEGNGRKTAADRRHYFIIARASLRECLPALELCRRKQLINDSDVAMLLEEMEQISRMISGLINSQVRGRS